MAARVEPATRKAGSGREPARHSARAQLASSSAAGATSREATVHEAKTHLSRLLAEVEAGGTVIITRRGKRVAKLEAVVERPKRVFGSMKGEFCLDDSFFDPLPEDELKAWYGN